MGRGHSRLSIMVLVRRGQGEGRGRDRNEGTRLEGELKRSGKRKRGKIRKQKEAGGKREKC